MLQITKPSNFQEPPIPNILKSKIRKKNIRQDIDNTIYQLFRSLHHQNQSNRMPILKPQLAFQYIQTIYSDYNISDPLKFQNRLKNTRKKAVQLKQCFLQQLSQSTLKFNTNIDIDASSYLQQQIKKIKPVFRYCFLCEKPILQANIQIHQTLQCSQFYHLYQMNIQEILNILQQKILIIRNNFKKCLYQLQNQQQAKDNVLKDIYKQYISKIDGFINDENNRNQRQIFNQITNHNRKYMQMAELSSKLCWFGYMHSTISKNYKISRNSLNFEQLFDRIHLSPHIRS